jgi:WD40 repeat protein
MSQSGNPPAPADSGEWTKTVLQWVLGVSALGTALATILAVYIQDVLAKKIAFSAAIALGLVFAVAYLRRRRGTATPPVDLVLPDGGATLRLLLPFEEGDPLPARAGEVQDLTALVVSMDFRFGLLCGDSGCGKTSLLRAGLLPSLIGRDHLPIYLPDPGNDPQAAISSAVARWVPDTIADPAATDLRELLRAIGKHHDKVPVVIYDQFEEFFLTHRTSSARTPFVRWVGDCVRDTSLDLKFLFGLRSDFLIRMDAFAPSVEDPTSMHTRYRLDNFYPDQARSMLQAAAAHDGIPFEPALIDAIVGDLTVDNAVRPPELQIVATRLKRHRPPILTVTGYQAIGGREGLLSSYITEVIAGARDPEMARLILRLLCPLDGDVRNPANLGLDEVLHALPSVPGTSARAQREKASAVLTWFVRARVVLQADDGRYNLVHDYLIPYIRQATMGVETKVERANRVLRGYLAAYRDDPRTRIPWRAQRMIKRDASSELLQEEKVRALLRQSTKTRYITKAQLVGVMLLLTLAYSGVYTGYDGWKSTGTLSVGNAIPQEFAFDASGSVLALEPITREIELWDVATQTLVGSLTGTNSENYSRSLAFSPARDQLAIADAAGGLEHIQIWTITNQKKYYLSAKPNSIACTCPACTPLRLAFSPDGSRLALGDGCGVIRLWRVGTTFQPAPAPKLVGMTSQPIIPVFGLTGDEVFALEGANSILRWQISGHTANRSQLSTTSINGGIATDEGCGQSGIMLHQPDGHLWVVTKSPIGAPRQMEVWDLISKHQIAYVTWSDVTGMIRCIAVNPAGEEIAFSDGTGGDVKLVNLGPEHLTALFLGDPSALQTGNPMAFGPDGRHLVALSQQVFLNERGLWIWGLRIPGSW